MSGADHQIKLDASRIVWSNDLRLATRRNPTFWMKLLLQWFICIRFKKSHQASFVSRSNLCMYYNVSKRNMNILPFCRLSNLQMLLYLQPFELIIPNKFIFIKIFGVFTDAQLRCSKRANKGTVIKRNLQKHHFKSYQHVSMNWSLENRI